MKKNEDKFYSILAKITMGSVILVAIATAAVWLPLYLLGEIYYKVVDNDKKKKQ